MDLSVIYSFHLYIDHRKNNKKFASFLKKLEKDRSLKNLSLESFLIMPVQRVPRYVMLLTDLLKNTWNDHPDHEDLKQALAKMKETGDFINESKRDSESIMKLHDICSKIKNSKIQGLFSPSRRWIKQGDVQLIHKNKSKDVTLHLFNDLILFVKSEKKDKLSVQGKMILQDLLVAEFDDHKKFHNVTKLIGASDYNHRRNRTEIYFNVPDPNTRTSWINEIDKAVILTSKKRDSFKVALRTTISLK
eukprot:TRINITY_DN9529_c0_g2_i1.p1 TRINITY_DN9529_c0_g2~~TRINITY_DN9529_c0_g2_i1.p1  ORF type:complete len:247 (+),score=57.52 TRINITY_DN9529_c0_g2_i1:3-743(+)